MDQHDLSQRNRRRQALMQADDDNLVFTFANDRERNTTINALRVAAAKFEECAAIVAADTSGLADYRRIIDQFKLQSVQAKCLATRIELQGESDEDDSALLDQVPLGLVRRAGVVFSCGQTACTDCYRNGPHVATDDEGRAHDADCAIRVSPSAECTCSKFNPEGYR